MPSTRDRSLTAALELLASGGMRALTHARVDAEAVLPRGSTSNHFRTRQALIEGVIGRLERSDYAEWLLSYEWGEPSVERFCAAICAGVDDMTGVGRTQTLARYALVLEGTHNAVVAEAIRVGRDRLRGWAAGAIAGLGVDDAEARASALFAFIDGVVLHRLSLLEEDLPDASVDVQPTVRRMLASPDAVPSA
ncbi:MULTISPECIES: TetR/AcrR family transcriptional regulator [unclassified Pseudoclavibacter]|uniref:TetR/AcrR family transcriptional regulator n=1 Tax=unclassified Pseudoclavibacter TaxID=2615177 RepID=UPI000CE8BDD5|nr:MULTISPECIES: TetR family transcriptional regulator [unclassified Pseudoclavibacter]PPF38664.1 TetR family transcriptional regulator [Pseudoclavibacter sp. AY1H1]PPF75050.1 TetR family transcriptional regulator [Pseudoclavibacter sp. Z016]